MESEHLKRILQNQDRITSAQVVFVDIEKYSQRRTSSQVTVIDEFTKLIKEAIKLTSQQYIDHSQKNSINLSTDLITLPTGDGAAIVFTFQGLHDIHLFFAKGLLKLVDDFNKQNKCEKFDQDGWCNCHKNINLRIGISEGKLIIYQDINERYNAAGKVMNMAARVMSKIDRNQIVFTEDAYRQIIDMVTDPNFVEEFSEYKNIEIKHGNKINMYLYKGKPNDKYINSNPPQFLEMTRTAEELMTHMGMPLENPFANNPKAAMEILTKLNDGVKKLKEKT